MAWMPRLIHQEPARAKSNDAVTRIWCGSERDYVDRNGHRWLADRFFTGGQAFVTQAAISGAAPTTDDQALYQAGRHGADFSYAIPVAPGLYALRLKLTEPEHEWSFQRPFNLAINGAPVLTNYDVCAASRGPRRDCTRCN